MPPQIIAHKRTLTANNPPTALAEGELCVEMATPARLWVGVPTTLDPSGRKLLSDRTADKAYIDSVAGVAIGDTPPAAPAPGDLWWESDSGILWLWYDDGTSQQWVQAAGSSGGSAPPPLDAYTKAEADTKFVDAAGDTMTGALVVTQTVTVGSGNGVGARKINFGSSGAQSLTFDNYVYTLAGGTLICDAILATYAVTADTFWSTGFRYYFGSVATAYLEYSATGEFGLTGGPLNIAAAPTMPNHVANKAYVDAAAGGGAVDAYTKAESDTRFVNVTGDTMTGDLTVNNSGLGVAYMGGIKFGDSAAKLQYDGGGFIFEGCSRVAAPAAGISGLTFTSADWVKVGASQANGDIYFGSTIANYLHFDGTALVYTLIGGPLRIAAAPVDPTDLANKAYVDANAGGGTPVDAYTKAESDANFVNAAGDTMTGGIVMTAGEFTISNVAGPAINLDKTADVWNCIYGKKNGVMHWRMDLGDGGAVTGGNAGSGFALNRFDDAGTYIGAVLSASRATGDATFGAGLAAAGQLSTSSNFYATGSINCAGTAMIGNAADAGATLYFGNTGGRYLSWDGTYLQIAGAPVHVASTISSWTVPTNPEHMVRKAELDAAIAALPPPAVDLSPYINRWGDTMSGPLTIATTASVSFAPSGGGTAAAIMMGADGTMRYVSGWLGNQWYDNTGTILSVEITENGIVVPALYGRQPGGGPWMSSSDARIKTVAGDYASGLDQIIALNPVRYTYKGNDTLVPSSQAEDAFGNKLSTSAAPYKNSAHFRVASDQREFVGLVAQECETVMPEMVSQRAGYIDDAPVTDLRDLDTGPLIFALVNACKELAARVAELETTVGIAQAKKG